MEDKSDLFEIEIDTIYKILDSIDNYRLLKVDPRAMDIEIQKAFFRESKYFHPDRHLHIKDEETRKKIKAIYERIIEAYSILKDPQLRELYDKKMAGGEKNLGTITRHDLEREMAEKKLSPDEVTKTKNGRKFWSLGLIAFEKKDYTGAVMNFKFALSYEPDNEIIKEKMVEAQKLLDEKKKKTYNPYRIKF